MTALSMALLILQYIFDVDLGHDGPINGPPHSTIYSTFLRLISAMTALSMALLILQYLLEVGLGHDGPFNGPPHSTIPSYG
jgi:hypothetical protein